MVEFTQTEREVIALNSIWEMIDGIVNYEMFVKPEQFHETNLVFHTSSHKRLFNILLGDFLSQPLKRGRNPVPFGLPEAPQGSRESDKTNLYYLRLICDDPQLNGPTDDLQGKVESFAKWLDAKAFVPNVWLPSIAIKLDLQVERITFIKICGNIGKHNFVRLENNVGKVCSILAEHGHPIDESQGYSVLGDFYEWFHSHVFSYHASTIAEHLNELRWAVFHYLEPEFGRSYHGTDGLPYRFDYPSTISDQFGRGMYWDLMNRMRAGPYLPRFTITSSLKNRY